MRRIFIAENFNMKCFVLVKRNIYNDAFLPYFKRWIYFQKMATPGDNNEKDLKCPEVKRGLKRKRVSLENLESVKRDILVDVIEIEDDEAECSVKSDNGKNTDNESKQRGEATSSNDSSMYYRFFFVYIIFN